MKKNNNNLFNYVVYEIFPKSFKDSNNDGIGDLPGITSKLDYLEWLGISYIWLTPINKSPQVDAGYDVSDYYDIHKEFGTLKDLEVLIKEAKKRKIGIILDIVINHTSIEHKWFQKALSGDKKYQDFYYFKEGKNKNEPPNNWKSIFGGSAWTYVKHLNKWYLHIFASEQPDLNWNNKMVRSEMAKMTSFWIKKGIKGFRIDAIIHIGKPDLDDATAESYVKAHGGKLEDFDYKNDLTATFHKFSNQPNFTKLFSDYKNMVEGKDTVLWVGESSSASYEIYKKLTNKDDNLLDLSCIFHHTGLHKSTPKWWEHMQVNDRAFFETFKGWQEFLQENNLVICLNFSSHDHARIVSCYGNDKKYRLESSKALGGFMFFLRGVPFVYFGEELGMPNHPFKSIYELDDIRTIGDYKDYLKWLPEKEAIKAAIANSRDHARTPMPWEDREDLGWGSKNPWLPFDLRNRKLSVEKQYYDNNSTLHFFKKLIDLRKNSKIIQEGSILFIRTYVERVYLYKRKLGNKTLYVYTSLNEKEMVLKNKIVDGKIFLNNYKTFNSKKLLPFQFIVMETNA